MSSARSLVIALLALLIISIGSPIAVAQVSIPPTPSPGPSPIGEPSKKPSPSQPIVVPSPSKPGEHKDITVITVPAKKSKSEQKPASSVTASGSTKPVKTEEIILNLKKLAEEEKKVSETETGLVKLITGDVVAFRKVGDKFYVAIKPAKLGRKFFVLNPSPHELYVIPSDVDTKKFDIALFNVLYLAKYFRLMKSLPIIVKVSESIPPERVLVEYTKEIPKATGMRFTIIRAFSLYIPFNELKLAYEKLAIDPRVEKVVLDRIVHLSTVSDDEYRALLYNSTKLVGAASAWKLGINGTGIRIAILDTGIDPTHPDFYFPNGTSKIIANASFVDYDGDGVPDEPVIDGHGHGTHCAAIAAGTGQASNGSIKGVAPGALLVIGKVLSDAGWGLDSWIIKGIEWAVNQSADVISMSLGGWPTMGYDPLVAAVENAVEKGVVVVIAAGNEGDLGLFSVSSPGVAPDAITVAAVDKDLNLAWFSSLGPTINLTLKPDIAAPGVMIASARANHTYMGPPASKYYVFASGTSMATPHVAGLAALVKQAYILRSERISQSFSETLPAPSASTIKSMLLSYAQPINASPFEVGAGFANVSDLIRALLDETTGLLYFEPSIATVYDDKPTFTIKAVYLCGSNNIGKNVTYTLSSYLLSWFRTSWRAVLSNVTIKPASFTIRCNASTPIVTVDIRVEVNWSAIPSGYHVLYIIANGTDGGSYNNLYSRPVYATIGLFKRFKLDVAIEGIESFGGYAIVRPTVDVGYLPTVFSFDTTPTTIEVPVAVPGFAYLVLVAATSYNTLLTTGAGYEDLSSIFLDPAYSSKTIVVDVSKQHSLDIMRDVDIELPTPGFIASGIFEDVADYNEYQAYASASVVSYGFSNILTVANLNSTQYIAESISSPCLSNNVTVELWAQPEFTAIWDDNGVLRGYYKTWGIPQSSDEVVNTSPVYEADITLRYIGDELVYLTLYPYIEGMYIMISPQLGYPTPSKVVFRFYTNNYAYSIETPIYIYVYDENNNEIGYLQFDNPMYIWVPFDNYTAVLDPLRAPYGTTVWLSSTELWKGIDGRPYVVEEHYVRFLDSWWMYYYGISAWSTLYIDGIAITTEYDDDPGVYIYGWKDSYNKTWSSIEVRSGATLSWAKPYIKLYTSLSSKTTLYLEGIPKSVAPGVPAYQMWSYWWYEVPGYGVQYIYIEPLTIYNTIPTNLTSEGSVILLIRAFEASSTTALSVEMEFIDENGTVVMPINVTGIEELDSGYYIVYGSFNPLKLPNMELGLYIKIAETNISAEYITGFSYVYTAYPALRAAPLILSPIYVAPTVPPGNYTSLREAIEVAYPNQTIYVYPGVYEEGELEITKPLKIIGIVKNSKMPIIIGSVYAHDINVGLRLENLTLIGASYVTIYSNNVYTLTLRNLVIYSDYTGIAIFGFKNLTLESALIIAPAYGLVLRNTVPPYDSMVAHAVMKDIVIYETAFAPIRMWIYANALDIDYSGIYVNESGTLVPVTIVTASNTQSFDIDASKLSAYSVILLYNVSDARIHDAELKYLHLFSVYGSTTVSNVLFLNRTYDTFDWLSIWGGYLTLINVTRLQALGVKEHVEGLPWWSSLFMVSGGSVRIVNSTLDKLQATGIEVYIENTTVLIPPESYTYVGSDGAIVVKNSVFRGAVEKVPIALYVEGYGAYSAIVESCTFSDAEYGVVVTNIPVPIVKSSAFHRVDVPVVLVPYGSAPSLPYYPPSTSSSPLFLDQTVFSREPTPPVENVSAYIYSNTFLSCRTCVDVFLTPSSVVYLANNTFISSDYSFLKLVNASRVGMWFNVFKAPVVLTIANVSYVYTNFNNFGSYVELNYTGIKIADIRWNYFSKSVYYLSMDNVLQLLDKPLYGAPLSLPLEKLVPVPRYIDHAVLALGLHEPATIALFNPYNESITASYSIEATPGLYVENHVRGSVSLSPSETIEIPVEVEAVSPGTSAIYVYLDGFKVWFPIRVLQVSARIDITVPSSIVRGSIFNASIAINLSTGANLSGSLVIVLNEYLEMFHPYPYARIVRIPIAIVNGYAETEISLRALHVGSGTISVWLYVADYPSAVNQTTATVRIEPNPQVNFTIERIYVSSMKAGSWGYMYIAIRGDDNYTVFTNISVETSNVSILALGYGATDIVEGTVRIEPSSMVHVYVPLKGVNPGNATLTITLRDDEDGLQPIVKTVSVYVEPPLVWNYTVWKALVEPSAPSSEIDIVYPSTVVKAWLWGSVYASKVTLSYDSLKYLMRVPWGCVEQTTSPLLDDIELHKYLDRSNLWSNVSNIINRTELEEYIKLGVYKLVKEHLDCNDTMCWYGWYPELHPMIFYTSYGLIGLLHAYEFAYVRYPQYYGTEFDLGIDRIELETAIKKLVNFLLAEQRSDGSWRLPEGTWDYIVDPVPLTAFATYALAKAIELNLVENTTLAMQALEKAVSWLETQQRADGGWRANEGTELSDAYTTGLALMALAQANISGVAIGLDSVEAGVEYLNKTITVSGWAGYWNAPSTWISWWNRCRWATTAHALIGLSMIREALGSYLPAATVTTLDRLINLSSYFLITTASIWIYSSTRTVAAVLWALNSVGADLSFQEIPVVNIVIEGISDSGSEVLMNRTVVFDTPYEYETFFFDLTNISGSNWLSKYRHYVVELRLVSGKASILATVATLYAYYRSTSSSSYVGTFLGRPVESVTLYLVRGSEVYRLVQIEPSTASSNSYSLTISKYVERAAVAPNASVAVKLLIKASTVTPFVTVTDPIPPGFKAVVNLTELALRGIAFDEKRFNESGGTIIDRGGDTLVLTGGVLAFALESVDSSGTVIRYELIPVNVSYGSRITLPTANVSVFYTPAGETIENRTVTTPTLTIGVNPVISFTARVLQEKVSLTNNSMLDWGKKLVVSLANMPPDLELNVSMIVMFNNTILLDKATTCRGSASLALDTLELANVSSKVAGQSIAIELRVAYDDALLFSKTYTLKLPQISRYSLFERMRDIALRYLTASPSEREYMEQHEIKPLRTLWAAGG